MAGAVSGLTMVVAMWLFHSEHSPLYEYAIWHPDIGNALGTLNLPAFFVGIVASGNVHQPSVTVAYFATFVQWALVGCVVASLISWWHASSHASEGDA